jgi:hypothetical protein
MESQEAANIIAALAAVACIGFGIFALLKGLKAEGAIEFAELGKGKVGMAGAGVLRLLFGAIIATAFNYGRRLENWIGLKKNPLEAGNWRSGMSFDRA